MRFRQSLKDAESPVKPCRRRRCAAPQLHAQAAIAPAEHFRASDELPFTSIRSLIAHQARAQAAPAQLWPCRLPQRPIAAASTRVRRPGCNAIGRRGCPASAAAPAAALRCRRRPPPLPCCAPQYPGTWTPPTTPTALRWQRCSSTCMSTATREASRHCRGLACCISPAPPLRPRTLPAAVRSVPVSSREPLLLGNHACKQP